MAFSIRKRDDRRRSTDQGLLDASLMQSLQDRFCDANNVYLVCLSKKRGVVTKAYGSKEELGYIHGIVNMDMHVSLMNKLLDNGIESVLEEDCGTDLVKMCGVSIKVGGETAATWIVIGVMENNDADVPECVMRTTPERYYKSLEFLETLSKQMFAVKMEELLAQEAFLKSRESEAQMEAELHRNEVMTAIVKMLESENGFDKIVDDILKDVCEYLDVSTGFLLREDKSGAHAEMICEYVSADTGSVIESWTMREKTVIPFFNGKPYMISANSMMPDEFHRYFEQEGIRAGIFLPIEVNGHATMYLCFCEKSKDRIWDVSDIKFVNDVKRIIQSILVKRIAKNSLASSYASLEAILENVGCGICVKDPVSNQTLYTNQRFRESFGGSVENGFLEQYLAKNQEEEGSDYFREVYSEGENRWYDMHRTRINWVDGRTVLLCTIYDVTDKKLYQQKIEKQANNDFLTGLYNRMRCEHDLEYYIRQTKEFGGEGALLYIDLDDFKHINDGLGHQYGDVLLKNISDSLKNIPGVENNCYRMGGDEFIIILAHHNIMMLQQILEEIKTLFTRPWMLKGADYYCTMSMGVVRFPKDGDTVEELIKKADIAMYEAKCSGKNRVEFYDDNVESTSFKRLDLEKNMRNATKNACEEFEVCYQPIIDITKPGNPCVGAEALLRWNSDELGMIAPTEFIPLAEYLGLINPIGEFVLKEACRSCKYWNDMGRPDYKVNVNLSVVQLLQNDVVDTIQSVIRETGILPENLTLEVTESLAINDMTRMKQILADIRNLGVKVALDDFGTGYSSLNHIREMPLDVIKIDRCFVIDIGKDEFQTAFVKMVAELASAINVKVCVEGVETEEQYAAVKDTKIQLIQGFYFGRPMHRDDFEKEYL
ncbi:MAG: EAL domain-containing protein [Clostridiales bacterium]|nr:EAL domain-containing protein [Roseburia sp.]MDD7635603.1 EAL domain-containing protein [Clostridiales bacterium]MDY4111999.1 EAL domain-containing protein [Roseburia sp.]